MKPMPKRRAKEKKDVQEPLREGLHALGWVTEKTHGNRYMKGWPDLYCLHRTYGAFWVECKRPKGGKLTPAQVELFARWEDAGVEVFVLNDPTVEGFLGTIYGPSNWRDWL